MNTAVLEQCTGQLQNRPSPPGNHPGIWLALSPVQWGIWLKMRPGRWGIWLSCQNVCRRSEAKGFCNSLIQHVSRVHVSLLLSIPRDVGFTVVVILYSYIVEYAVVLSVERRRAEQEIRSGWKFWRTCFTVALTCVEGGGFDPLWSSKGWGIWPSKLAT